MIGKNGSVIVFLAVVLTVIFGGFTYYFYMQLLPPSKNVVKCTNDIATISFLINDGDKTVLMDGKILSSKVIDLFNETVISANWKTKGEYTKIFLDRMAGGLDIETSFDGSNWIKDTLSCVKATAHF